MCLKIVDSKKKGERERGKRHGKKNRMSLSTVSIVVHTLFATVGTLPRLLIPRGYRSTTVLPLLPEYVNLLCRREWSAYTRAKYPDAVRRWSELSTTAGLAVHIYAYVYMCVCVYVKYFNFPKIFIPPSSATG